MADKMQIKILLVHTWATRDCSQKEKQQSLESRSFTAIFISHLLLESMSAGNTEGQEKV